MIKGVIIFGAGLYTGVYVAQNYQIDKVENPQVLFQKAQTYIQEALASAKDASKGDKGDGKCK